MLPIQPAIVQSISLPLLADMLPGVRWSVAERGPLLVIGAETVPGTREKSQLSGMSLREFLPYFKRKLIRAGKMWVIAPENVTAVSDLRGITPEKLAAQGAPLLTLFNGFTPANWKRAASPAGLGREDLPQKLRPLFDVLLPQQNTLYVYDEQVPFSERHRRFVPLSLEQRAGIKLHVAWSYEW